jgi:hypothetical protein
MLRRPWPKEADPAQVAHANEEAEIQSGSFICAAVLRSESSSKRISRLFHPPIGKEGPPGAGEPFTGFMTPG